MEIGGLPLHALVVHATVVLIPLSALLVIAFAVLPGWRWLSRWPTAAAAVAVVVLALIAQQSGEALLEARPFLLDAPPLAAQLETHEERGDLLFWLSIPFAVLVLFGTWSLGGTSALATGKGARESRISVADKVLPVVLVLAAVGIIVLTVLTGDAGARAVWG
jgi:hypothetical protein